MDSHSSSSSQVPAGYDEAKVTPEHLREAAGAVTAALAKAGQPFAFAGGYAFQMLGMGRETKARLPTRA